MQTTDALTFRDPLSGNRILVQLEAGKDFIDINGKELVSCISDEIENRQFNIGSMTNSWAMILIMVGALAGVIAVFFRRRMHENLFEGTGLDDDETPTIRDAIIADVSVETKDDDQPSPDTKTPPQ